MGRLFWKIFLTFWLTLILVLLISNWGTALYLQTADDGHRAIERERLANVRLDAIASLLEYGGMRAVRNVLKNRRNLPRSFLKISIQNQSGKLILNKERRRLNRKNQVVEKINRKVNDPRGRQYQITATFSKHSRPPLLFGFGLRPFERFPKLALIWLTVTIFISSIVCFWLAWTITKPIRQLRIASRQLATGELDTRVAKIMGKRRDEIGDLGKDFDYMASRLQQLLHSQKQLLSDISHELRSPLARMQVAVGLTRQKTNDAVSSELDRIEHEVVRLDDLVGQVLTLSRLETGNRYPKEDYVDIAVLLDETVRDAEFEAKDSNRHVALVTQRTWTLNANAELLHRALENIIRNAIRYTAENTQVDVSLGISHTFDTLNPMIEINVCDQGTGVPEEQIAKLFEPFVRVSDSRNRESGGYGLGLAIAERAVHLHNGKIRAFNRPEGGLCVSILLPTPIDDSQIQM